MEEGSEVIKSQTNLKTAVDFWFGGFWNFDMKQIDRRESKGEKDRFMAF